MGGMRSPRIRELRSERRTPVQLSVQIDPGDGQSFIDCFMTDVSAFASLGGFPPRGAPVKGSGQLVNKGECLFPTLCQ
jgi:hypothetical protein